jgi:hypothetical protein
MVAFAVIERRPCMSEFEKARAHLAEALKRLETALARRSMRPPAGVGSGGQRGLEQLEAERDGLARDVGMLRGECDRLSAALSEMQRDNRNLREVTGQVARRIDGSIAEIDRLLGA